jgi:CubicO group peptidase (beta-lactamase class C family)
MIVDVRTKGVVKDLVARIAPDLEACAASFVAEHRLPGATVGVVVGDGLAWTTGVGFACVETRQAPDATTLYRIASITKTFTGIAIMQLCDAGRLHLDDPAVAHLPELRKASSPFGPIETVTIRRMLSHESGLAVEPPGTDLAVPTYESVAVRNLARAADIGIKVPPNLQQKYSNLAYQLLGEITARISGTPYPRYVQEAILDPLAMRATSFEPLPGTLPAQCATGYQGRAFSDQLDLALAFAPFWAEGGLWSCVEDLARWLSFQLRAYRDQPGAAPVLAAHTLRDMHKPRYIADDAWTRAWGVSWNAIRREDVVWIQHSGGLPGFCSNVCFDPITQVGTIVLLNGEGDAAALAMDLAEICRRSVRASPRAIEPPAPTPDAYRPLLGLYAWPFASAGLEHLIRLEWRDAKLVFVDPDAPDWRPILCPTGDPDIFVVGPGYRQSGEPVIFRRLADGRVASAFLAEATLIRLDSVVSGD